MPNKPAWRKISDSVDAMGEDFREHLRVMNNASMAALQGENEKMMWEEMKRALSAMQSALEILEKELESI